MVRDLFHVQSVKGKEELLKPLVDHINAIIVMDQE
jgi:hypothetical protein